MKSPFLRVDEVAVMIRYTDKTTGAPQVKRTREFIYRWIPKQKHRHVGRELRVHEDDIKAHMERRQQL